LTTFCSSRDNKACACASGAGVTASSATHSHDGPDNGN
jgi:hypothetical protein